MPRRSCRVSIYCKEVRRKRRGVRLCRMPAKCFLPRRKGVVRILRHLLCVLPFIVFAIRRVLPHPLHGNPSQNLAAKGAKQSKAVYFAVRRGERRSACRVARASLSTMHHRKIGAFDRVRITPLQYRSDDRERAKQSRPRCSKAEKMPGPKTRWTRCS